MAALFCAAAPMPAFAQLFSDEAAREQTAKNAEQISEISAQLGDLARIVENLRNRLGAMAQEQQSAGLRLRELQGKIEEFGASVAAERNAALKPLGASASRAQQERAQLAAEVAALTESFAALSENFTALSVRFDEVGEFISPPSEEELYEAAFAEYRSGEFANAAEGFQRILGYYPEGRFGANAHYWMSLSFLAAGEYERAAEAARRLMSLYENSDKIPDAMLALARAQQNLGRAEESRATLESLVEAHPTTLAADQARHLLSPSPAP